MSRKHHSIYSSRKFPVLSLIISMGGGILLALILYWNIVPSKADKSKQQKKQNNHAVVVTEPHGKYYLQAGKFTFYKDCANKIKLIPAKSTQSHTNLSSTDAHIYPGSSTEEFIVSSGRDYITLNYGDAPLQSSRIKMIAPPKPSLEVLANNQPITENPVSVHAEISIRIIPDPDFAVDYPQDAIYEIGQVDVLTQVSEAGMAVVETYSHSSNVDLTSHPVFVELGDKVKSARPGTSVIIRIHKVYRKNFQKKYIEDLRFQPHELMISFNVY